MTYLALFFVASDAITVLGGKSVNEFLTGVVMVFLRFPVLKFGLFLSFIELTEV